MTAAEIDTEHTDHFEKIRELSGGFHQILVKVI